MVKKKKTHGTTVCVQLLGDDESMEETEDDDTPGNSPSNTGRKTFWYVVLYSLCTRNDSYIGGMRECDRLIQVPITNRLLTKISSGYWMNYVRISLVVCTVLVIIPRRFVDDEWGSATCIWRRDTPTRTVDRRRARGRRREVAPPAYYSHNLQTPVRVSRPLVASSVYKQWFDVGAAGGAGNHRPTHQ